MDFTFLFDPTRKLFHIGFRVGTARSTRATTTCSPRRPADQLLAIAKGDVPGRHWFGLGRALTPVGRGSALLVVGVDVRVPHARARHAHAAPQPLHTPTTSSSPARSSYAGGARRAVGDVRVSFKRPRPRADLPVLELWCTRPGAEARPQRAPGRHRPARHVSCSRWSPARSGVGTSPACARRPARRSITRRCATEGATVAVVKRYMAHHQGMTLVALWQRPAGVMVEPFPDADPIVLARHPLLEQQLGRLDDRVGVEARPASHGR